MQNKRTGFHRALERFDNMKKNRLVLILLVSSLLISGCGNTSNSAVSSEASKETISSEKAVSDTVSSSSTSTIVSSSELQAIEDSSETSIEVADAIETVYTTTEESLIQLFEDYIGKCSDLDISYYPDDEEKCVTISYTPIIYDETYFVSSRISEFINYSRYVYQMENVDLVSFDIKAIFIDSHGQQYSDTIMRIDMPKTVFDTYAWENLEYRNVYPIFNDEGAVYVEPSMLQDVDQTSVYYNPDFDPSVQVK